MVRVEGLLDLRDPTVALIFSVICWAAVVLAPSWSLAVSRDAALICVTMLLIAQGAFHELRKFRGTAAQ